MPNHAPERTAHDAASTLPASAEEQKAGEVNAADTVRTPQQKNVARFFDGYDLIDPGLVPVLPWRPADHPAGGQTLEPDAAQRCHNGTTMQTIRRRPGFAPRAFAQASGQPPADTQRRAHTGHRQRRNLPGPVPLPAASGAWAHLAGSAGPR